MAWSATLEHVMTSSRASSARDALHTTPSCIAAWRLYADDFAMLAVLETLTLWLPRRNGCIVATSTNGTDLNGYVEYMKLLCIVLAGPTTDKSRRFDGNI